MEGQIKRIVKDRGFGFIREDRTQVEYFFHKSGLANGERFEQFEEGNRVLFEVEESAKGPRATKVEIR